MKLLRVPFAVLLCFSLLVFFFVSNPASARQTITYPKLIKPYAPRDDLLALLRTSLEKTSQEFGPYKMTPSENRMNEARYIHEAKRDGRVNVIWSSTSPEKERQLIPIRIPLRKGLLGYRISLIDQSDQDTFTRIQTREQLKQLTIGQGEGWGDVMLYRRNGFEVVTSTSYEGLFRMVLKDRFDHFPLGINEVFTEFNERKEKFPELSLEKNMMIYYPWPYYFFVSPGNPELAERIETGLRRMIEDGTFDEIFRKYHGDVIETVDFEKRRVFTLDNPLLTDTTPLNNDKIWFGRKFLDKQPDQ